MKDERGTQLEKGLSCIQPLSTPRFWTFLCCPETKQTMTLLDEASLERLNRKIRDGKLENKGGSLVKEPLEGGLLRSDKKVAYPIREAIPIMLIEEGIPMDGIL